MHLKKNGILLVAYGASTLSAQNALCAFEQQVQAIYPHTAIRWAFTSPAVRRRMEKNNQKADSLEKALLQMISDKYTSVAIQSLHILAGIEYESMENEIKKIIEGRSIIVEVGHPLLWDQEDVEQTSEALLHSLPKERLPEDAIIYVGHGTQHEQEKRYNDLATCITHKDPLVLLGTLEGETTMTTILSLLKNKKAKHVWLLPFLSLIGNHAQKDIAGEEKTSWKSVVENEGFTCTPVLKGVVESKEIAIIWLNHLKQAVEKLHSFW